MWFPLQGLVALCFKVLPVFWFTLQSRSCDDGRNLTHSVAKPWNAVSHIRCKWLKNLATRMVPCAKMECGEGGNWGKFHVLSCTDQILIATLNVCVTVSQWVLWWGGGTAADMVRRKWFCRLSLCYTQYVCCNWLCGLVLYEAFWFVAVVRFKVK